MAEKFKYRGGIDYIDSILGAFTGRSMPPLVTADFVSLDVHNTIVDNLYKNTKDYGYETFRIPDFVRKLIDKGKTGRKAGEGLYKTVIHESGVKIYQVYDIAHDYYRERMDHVFPFTEEMISFLQVGGYEAAFKALIDNQSLEASAPSG